MNRSKFIRTSCGFIAAAVTPGIWNIFNPINEKKKFNIRPYKPEESELEVPIYKVTPSDGHYNYTYYDIPVHSPSGRYLAVTRVPFLEDRFPKYGEIADVCVIDLQEETIETVYRTKSWGFQTGALLHWGRDDRHVYTNDSFKGQRAVCVQIDLHTGKTTAFDGPMYNLAPDGSFAVGFPLELLNVTQQGYGIASKDPDNPQTLPVGAADDEGVWKTDLMSNRKTLLVSLADLAAHIPEPPPRKDGTFYLWHTKVNPQSNRILQVLRCLFPDGSGGRNAMVFTFNPDGSDIQWTPSDPVWGQAGGHPNWHPNGTHIIRNLKVDGPDEPYRFCKFFYDGSDFEVLSRTIKGGGHPRITPDSKYIITDDYPRENGTQKVSLRLIDLVAEDEAMVAKMVTSEKQGLTNSALRFDGHPTWNRDFTKFAFQAAPEGMRQIFVADLADIIR